MAPSGYRRSRLGAVRCSHCRIGDRPGDDDRDIRPRRRGPPGCQADATAAAGRGPRRAARHPRGQGAAGHRPDRAPLRGRHGDPAPGGRALAGGRSAVPRERVQLAAGRHAALPVPAIRAALLRAADGSAPDAGRRRGRRGHAGGRDRRLPASRDPVGLAAARARLATLRRGDLRGERADAPVRGVRVPVLSSRRRALEAGRPRCRRSIRVGRRGRRARDARGSDQGLAAARVAVRPSTSAARGPRRRARGRAHRRRHRWP